MNRGHVNENMDWMSFRDWVSTPQFEIIFVKLINKWQQPQQGDIEQIHSTRQPFKHFFVMM